MDTYAIMATSPPLLVVGGTAQPATNYGGDDTGPERYFMYDRTFQTPAACGNTLSRNSSTKSRSSITSVSSISVDTTLERMHRWSRSDFADADGGDYVATSTTVLTTIDLPPGGGDQFRNSSNYGTSSKATVPLWKSHPSSDSLMYSQSSSNTGRDSLSHKTGSNRKKRSAGGKRPPTRNRRSMMDLIEDIKEESFDVGSDRSDDASFLGLEHIKKTPRSGNGRKVPKRSCDRLGRGRNSRRKLHQRRRRSDRGMGIPQSNIHGSFHYRERKGRMSV